MKLTKLIYVASPYSCTGKDKKIPELAQHAIRVNRCNDVDKCIGKLQDTYPYAFIGPITQSHRTARHMKFADTGFGAWELRDLTYISRCDEVWVLMIDGWKESTGVTKELEFAVTNDIPIRFINPKNHKVKKLELL